MCSFAPHWVLRVEVACAIDSSHEARLPKHLLLSTTRLLRGNFECQEWPRKLQFEESLRPRSQLRNCEAHDLKDHCQFD